MCSADLRSASWRIALLCCVALLVSTGTVACGGIEEPTDSVGKSEQQVVEKVIKLPTPARSVWGWDCRPGYEDPDCPAPGSPGCTVGDVDSGNCVCPWPDYCEPFFD